MNHLTFFIDVAGRVSRSTEVFHLVTAAAVAVPTDALPGMRTALAANTGKKWAQTDFTGADAIVDVLIEHAVAVGAFTVNKSTPAWDKFWDDSLRIENLIRSQDGKKAGFVRAPNVLRFHLMGEAATIAFGRAHWRTRSTPRLVDASGRALMEYHMVFDNDIQGNENEEMLETMLDTPMPRSEQAFNFTHRRRTTVATEQKEPLLLLPDFAAGIVHAAFLPEAGNFLPLTQAQAQQLVQRLDRAALLAIHNADFDADCSEVFGELMELAQAGGKSRPAPT